MTGLLLINNHRQRKTCVMLFFSTVAKFCLNMALTIFAKFYFILDLAFVSVCVLLYLLS